MRNFIIFTLAISIFSFISCDKTETPQTPDDIIYTEINKTIYKYSFDSISGTCYDLVFEIAEDRQQVFMGVLKQNFNHDLCCDGSNSILVDYNGQVVNLNENHEIKDHDNWTSFFDLSLDNFAGQGEKYIAYRSHSYGDGNDHYRYGWIKIELSPKQDTLKIISRATNQTEGFPILTGQKQ